MAELTSSESTDIYGLPSELVPNESRGKRRLKAKDLTEHAIIADIRSLGTRVLGYVNELTSDEFSVLVPLDSVELQPSQVVKVRLQLRGVYALACECRVLFLRQLRDQLFEVILSPTPGHKASGEVSRESRVQTSQKDQVLLRWPDEKGHSARATVLNRSWFGMACVATGKWAFLPPVGSICALPELGLRARIAWKDVSAFGLDLRVNPRSALQRWLIQLDAEQKGTIVLDQELKYSKRLLSIFLRSGSLKGQRTASFSGLDIEDLLPIERESLDWVRRFSGSLSGDHTDYHVSFLRMSDMSWMIQELGQSSETTGHGEDILRRSIGFFRDQEGPTPAPSSVLVVVFDPRSKFNMSFWERQSFKDLTYGGSIAVVPTQTLSELQEPGSLFTDDFEIIEPSDTNWDELRAALGAQFDSRLLAGMGLGKDDFGSHHFQNTLSQKGIELQRRVSVLKRSGRTCGAFVQMGLPPLSNVSGLADALYVLLADEVPATSALNWLWKNAPTNGLLTGVTDLLVIKNSAGVDVELANATRVREFRIRSMPIGALRKILGST
jgi:hypothetical protein